MPPSPDDRRLGLTWAFAAALGGAGFVIPWKLANEVGEPDLSAVIMLAAAAAANSLLVLAHRMRRGALRSPPLGTAVAVAAALATFTLLGNLASARAIHSLSPALLNVLLRAEVILVALVAWVFLGERVERRFWIGAALAMVGLFLLQDRGSDDPNASPIGAGTGMALAAAACFSGLAVLTRRFIHRIDPVLVNALRLWFAVALWFPFHTLPRWEAIPRAQIGWAVTAAMLGPFASRLCLMLSARHVEARTTTLVNLTSPVMTVPLAWALLSDLPRLHQLIGGAVMMAGIAVPLLPFRSRDRARGEPDPHASA
ncbi:MAG: DMT family transporter [Myxococcota bacterium]